MPLKQQSFTCIYIYFFVSLYLPAVVLQPGYSLRKNKLRMPSSDFKKIIFTVALYRTGAGGAARDTAAVTTQPRAVHNDTTGFLHILTFISIS